MAKDTDKQAPSKDGAKDGAKKGPPAGKAPREGGTKKPAPTKHAAHAEEDTGPREPARLRVQYEQRVRAAFAEKFGVSNRMAQPRLEKIVLNVNMGRHLDGTKIPPHIRAQVVDTLTRVTGQKPVVVKARKSVSNFKLRAGYESSAMVTIRRDRMWHFLDRLINLATPRIKDFRGLNDKAFDRQGNYSMGLTEQGVFPEINMAEAQFTHGMHINMCFRNSTPEKSKFVLEQLGMPFRKPDQQR
jgi:large subunit ribosomal protein L5